MYTYVPFKRRPIKSGDKTWVEGSMALVMIVQEIFDLNGTSKSSGQPGLRFGGREHFIPPDVVLEHGADFVAG